jgi:hypothetical protein
MNSSDEFDLVSINMSDVEDRILTTQRMPGKSVTRQGPISINYSAPEMRIRESRLRHTAVTLHLLALGFTHREMEELDKAVLAANSTSATKFSQKIGVRLTARKTNRLGARLFGRKAWQSRKAPKTKQPFALLYRVPVVGPFNDRLPVVWPFNDDPWAPLWKLKDLDLNQEPY